MSLRLPNDAKLFFKHISESASQPQGVRFMDMDKYYACLMLGLRAGELGSEDAMVPNSFLAAGSGYPEAYRETADVIAGLLVDAEIRRNNIDVTDRDQIEREVVKLLKPKSAMGLSDKGIDLLNRYTARGLEYLKSETIAPRSLELFLIDYGRVWDALDTQ